MSLQSSFDALTLGNITASLVVDSQGSAVGPAGTSKGIGNQTDFELLVYLRRRCEVVLTSGLTALKEHYRMPRGADLAILTTRSESDFDIPAGEASLLFLSGGYHASLKELADLGYSRVHTEFGPTGFTALVAADSVDALLSSTSEAGIKAFCDSQELRPEATLQISDLHIARFTGRGKG